MKLAIVCRPFSFHGGVETATAGLVAELARRGHAIDIVTTRAQGDWPGATPRRLPVWPGPSWLRLLSFALLARGATRRGGYDLVQSHERGLFQDIYRAGEGVHRAYLATLGRAVGANPRDRLLAALERRIFSLRSARHIAAIARIGKAEIERAFATPPERVTVVYNGVDLARFHPDHRARLGPAARESLGLARDAWVILFVGSGFQRKGLGPLVEGASRLVDRRWRLVVAGKGDTRPYERLAAGLGVADRVSWVGPRRDVEALYAAADVVALPALYEPFGNVHLEALASGVPVLASARSGGAEAVTSGRDGWVVQAPTPDAIAEGLRALREADAKSLGEAARRASESFTYAAQGDTLEALYRALVKP